MKQTRNLRYSTQPDTGGLLKTGVISLLLHVALVALLILNLRAAIPKGGLSVYRVTLRPFSPRGDGGPLGSAISEPSGSSGQLPASRAGENLKPAEKSRMVKSKKEEVPYLLKKQKSYERPTNQTLEGLKRTLKKEDLEKQKSYKHLQEAMEEINRKAALELIQKRVARREKLETGTTGEPGSTRLSQGSIASSSGTGTRSGAGTGPGGAGSPTGGSPWGSPFGGSSALESKLNDYYNMIWAKIKKEWTVAGDLPKGKTDMETIIVVIIERNGKIQKSWFEKKSGNAQYDQMAMRAIKKAEPLPPIPKEFSDETFEIGIRFHPD